MAVSLIGGVTVAGQPASSSTSPRAYDAQFRAAISKAEVQLQNEEHANHGALIFQARAGDGRFPEATARLFCTTKSYGPSRSTWVADNEIVTWYLEHNASIELRVAAPRFHESRREGVIERAKVTAWDDFLLERVTPETAATINGVIWLEDNADPSGLHVEIEGYPPTRTDDEGRFRFEGIAAGAAYIVAWESGYTNLQKQLEIARRAVVPCEIRGFRQRTALVRWAYQPKESRNLTKGVETGVASLAWNKLHRVSIADGFVQVDRDPDFRVSQRKTRLFIQAAVTKTGKASLLQVHGVPLNKIREAPNTRYSLNPLHLQTGNVYVFRLHNGEHYAKMEVIEVFDGLSSDDVLGVAFSSRCHVANPATLSAPLPSLAVLDLNADGSLPSSVVRAISDLARGVAQDTRRFVMVDRDSIIHILGKEDFISTVKCDDTRCLVNYGKKLRAQKILHGRINKIGKSFVLSLKIVDVSSAAVDAFNTERTTDGVDGLLGLIEDQTCELIRSAFAKPR